MIVALGTGLAITGAWLLSQARNAEELRGLTLRGIGRLSAATHAVLGISLIVVGYQVVVHALNWSHFRVPLRLAIAAAGIAVALSLLNDVIENRASK